MVSRPSCGLFSLTVSASLLTVALGAGQTRETGSPDVEVASYTIGAGDVLQVRVWHSPDLDQTVQVRPDGMISLPLVGELSVAELKPATVRERLVVLYREFVAEPTVSVIVIEVNSRAVFLLGEVQSPGSYDLIKPTRLVQALAMAGGFTEFAKSKKVVILRQGRDQPIKVNVEAIVKGKRPQDNLLLEPGDTIIVP